LPEILHRVGIISSLDKVYAALSEATILAGLLLPRSTAQWVSVDQNNRLARPMVFVLKLYIA
jgi:hypothetical protein